MRRTLRLGFPSEHERSHFSKPLVASFETDPEVPSLFGDQGLGSENNNLLRDRDENSDIDLDGLRF